MKALLVGYGYWGRNWARVLSESPLLSEMAIAEANPQRAETAQQRHPEARIFRNYEVALREFEPSAVVVALPAREHFTSALSAIRSGAHVLVEKPMCFTVVEGLTLRGEALSSGVLVMPGHTFLYSDAVQWAKDFVSRGELGELLYMYSKRLNLGQLRRDVDVLWNLAPHDVSIFNFLTDGAPVRAAATRIASLQQGVADVAFCTFEYESVTAQCHVSWLDPTKTRQVVLVGSERMLILDDVSPDAPITIYDKSFQPIDESPSDIDSGYQLRIGDVSIPALSRSEPLAAEVADFLKSAQAGTRPRADVDSGIAVAAALSAASLSMSSDGRTVNVEEWND